MDFSINVCYLLFNQHYLSHLSHPEASSVTTWKKKMTSGQFKDINFWADVTSFVISSMPLYQ